MLSEVGFTVPFANAKEWALGPSASKAATMSLTNVKWLDFMSKADFYSMYEMTCDGPPCSASHFQRAIYDGGWHNRLRFRHIVGRNVQSVCATCTKIKDFSHCANT